MWWVGVRAKDAYPLPCPAAWMDAASASIEEGSIRRASDRRAGCAVSCANALRAEADSIVCDAMVEAWDGGNGASYQAIADAAGLTRSRVHPSDRLRLASQ